MLYRCIIYKYVSYIICIVKNLLQHGESISFLCKCSFLEIYNEQIFDLLEPNGNTLQLHENMKRGIYVDGLHETTVSNPCEAYAVLRFGWKNRTVAETMMNRESSRSHAVFTFNIESKVCIVVIIVQG